MSKRNRITDTQREILEGFYRKGMVGTGTMYLELVLKAATDTGLTKEQVEVSFSSKLQYMYKLVKLMYFSLTFYYFTKQ